MRRLVTLWLLLLAVPVAAQTVSGDRFKLNTGPCMMRSGANAPESAVTGNVCDVFMRTDSTGGIYYKSSGTGTNTGWVGPLIAVPGSTGITTLGTITTGVWNAGAVSAAGEIRNTTAANLSPYTQARLTVYRDTGNWGYFGYSDYASLQVVLGKTGENRMLQFGTTSAVDNTGAFTESARLTEAGDATFASTLGSLTHMPNTGYTSDLGSLQTKWRSIHAAELWVETLVAQNTIATIGGRVLVAPTTTLVADLTAIATTIHVKHNQMASGDRVYMEADGKVEFMSIDSAAGGSAGDYTYTVTRNLDGSGANAWYAGDAMLNTGTTGNGFIDLYSVSGVMSGNGPTIVGNVRTGTTYNQIAPRWAAGNLNGLYGYSATTYGFAAGDSTASWFSVDPTNGVRLNYGVNTPVSLGAAGLVLRDNAGVLRAHLASTYFALYGDNPGTYLSLSSSGLSIVSNSQTKVSVDNSGNATFAGTVNAGAGYFGTGSTKVAINADGLDVGSAGRILGGMTAYNTGTGFWLGYSGAYKLSIGHDDGNRLTWDGTDLTLVSANTTIGSSGITVAKATDAATFYGARSYGFATTTSGMQYYDSLMLFSDTGKFGLYRLTGGSIDLNWVFGTEGANDDMYLVGGGPGTANLGRSAHQFDNVYATTYHSGSGVGASTGALTCSSGQAIKNLTVVGGIVTLAECAAVSQPTTDVALSAQVKSLEQRIADLEALITRR
jgi:hypothetical protein